MIMCSRRLITLPCTTWFLSSHFHPSAALYKSRTKRTDTEENSLVISSTRSSSSESSESSALYTVSTSAAQMPSKDSVSTESSNLLNSKDESFKHQDQSKSSLCSIMDCKTHVALQRDLILDSMTNLLVGYILATNIAVHRVALEYNVSITSRELPSRHLEKNQLSKNLDPKMKFGKFSKRDDAIIESNWKSLIEELGIDEGKANYEVFETKIEKREDGIKRNIIGYYLSQDLPDIRLATDVYHRAWLLKYVKKGYFSTEEDRIILASVETEGRKFAKLARELGRSRNSVRGRYYLLTQEDNCKDGTKYTFDDDKIIFAGIVGANANILNEEPIAKEDWARIGRQLQRSPNRVYHRWFSVLKPLLHKYHAGNLEVDMKETLINHMVDNGMNHAQDVDWMELTKLPQFSGSTVRNLQHLHGLLKQKTRNFFPELNPEQLTSMQIQKYLKTRNKRAVSKKKKEYEEKLIEYYRRLI